MRFKTEKIQYWKSCSELRNTETRWSLKKKLWIWKELAIRSTLRCKPTGSTCFWVSELVSFCSSLERAILWLSIDSFQKSSEKEVPSPYIMSQLKRCLIWRWQWKAGSTIRVRNLGYSNFARQETGIFISSNKNSFQDSRLNISMANVAQNTSLALANTSDEAGTRTFKEQQELPSKRLKDLYLDLL